MRIAYLSLDRADLHVIRMKLSSKMCAPRRDHMKRLQRVGQYLVKDFEGTMCCCPFWETACDADSHHCTGRNSTDMMLNYSGDVTQYRTSILRCQSTWQSTVSPSTEESEYCAIV
eukprot:5816399-Amphidinium_carterae.2